jgi:hypothetical protein
MRLAALKPNFSMLPALQVVCMWHEEVKGPGQEVSDPKFMHGYWEVVVTSDMQQVQVPVAKKPCKYRDRSLRAHPWYPP